MTYTNTKWCNRSREFRRFDETWTRSLISASIFRFYSQSERQLRSCNNTTGSIRTWTATHCLLFWLSTLIALDQSQLTRQLYFGGILGYWGSRLSRCLKMFALKHSNPNKNDFGCSFPNLYLPLNNIWIKSKQIGTCFSQRCVVVVFKTHCLWLFLTYYLRLNSHWDIGLYVLK